MGAYLRPLRYGCLELVQEYLDGVGVSPLGRQVQGCAVPAVQNVGAGIGLAQHLQHSLVPFHGGYMQRGHSFALEEHKHSRYIVILIEHQVDELYLDHVYRKIIPDHLIGL